MHPYFTNGGPLYGHEDGGDEGVTSHILPVQGHVEREKGLDWLCTA